MTNAKWNKVQLIWQISCYLPSCPLTLQRWVVTGTGIGIRQTFALHLKRFLFMKYTFACAEMFRIFGIRKLFEATLNTASYVSAGAGCR